MTEPKPLTEPTIFKVADIISNMGYGREAVKIMVKDEDEPGKKQKNLFFLWMPFLWLDENTTKMSLIWNWLHLEEKEIQISYLK